MLLYILKMGSASLLPWLAASIHSDSAVRNVDKVLVLDDTSQPVDLRALWYHITVKVLVSDDLQHNLRSSLVKQLCGSSEQYGDIRKSVSMRRLWRPGP